jgi:hypothetical protein
MYLEGLVVSTQEVFIFNNCDNGKAVVNIFLILLM